jgi:hypothetical protein
MGNEAIAVSYWRADAETPSADLVANLVDELERVLYPPDEIATAHVVQRITALSTPTLKLFAQLFFKDTRNRSRNEILAAIEKRRKQDVFDYNRRQAVTKAG